MSVTLPDIGEDPWGVELNAYLESLDDRVALLESIPPGDTTGITAVNGDVGPVVTLDLSEIPDTAVYTKMTVDERNKLAGIPPNATANSTDAQLRARSTHTGFQSADTLTDGTTNKAFTAAERTKLAGLTSGATVNQTDAYLLDRSHHTNTQSADTITDGATNKVYTAPEQTKLAGIATGATANSSDANLRDRNTHTGVQAMSTITGLSAALAAIQVSRYVVVWWDPVLNVWPNPGVDATIGVDWCSEVPGVPAPAAGGRPGYQRRDRIFIPKA